jgi:MinD-like ATPase involved in chromosome partitioning or flagellar assembly
VSKVSFYSPRGGTGRSLALANVAVAIAQKSKKVGIIDLDIEAGGLTEIFHIPGKDLKGDLISILLKDNVDQQLDDYLLDMADVSKVPDLNIDKDKLLFLPTIFDDKKASQLDLVSFGIPNEQTTRIIENIINTFWREYELEYLFIDSRTGGGGLATISLQNANLIIVLTRLNYQGLSACKRVLSTFHAKPKKYFMIASSVYKPSSHKEETDAAEKLMGHEFNHILPFAGELAFREKIMVVQHPRSSLSRAYRNLSELIINSEE